MDTHTKVQATIVHTTRGFGSTTKPSPNIVCFVLPSKPSKGSSSNKVPGEKHNRMFVSGFWSRHCHLQFSMFFTDGLHAKPLHGWYEATLRLPRCGASPCLFLAKRVQLVFVQVRRGGGNMDLKHREQKAAQEFQASHGTGAAWKATSSRRLGTSGTRCGSIKVKPTRKPHGVC